MNQSFGVWRHLYVQRTDCSGTCHTNSPRTNFSNITQYGSSYPIATGSMDQYNFLIWRLNIFNSPACYNLSIRNIKS